jgi:ABC-type proline/glycine betaine transport system permease subunit
MVLSSQPQRRTSVHQKKRTGSHQRQTKHYIKTYWPYIPLLAVAAALNVVLDKAVHGSSATTVASLSTVSRLELWTNSSQSITILVASVAFVCASVVVMRHADAWQRVLVRGEQFIVHNHKLDLALAGFALCGFLLTRNVIS